MVLVSPQSSVLWGLFTLLKGPTYLSISCLALGLALDKGFHLFSVVSLTDIQAWITDRLR